MDDHRTLMCEHSNDHVCELCRRRADGAQQPAAQAAGLAAGLADEQIEEVWSGVEWKDLSPVHEGFEKALRLRFARALLSRAAPSGEVARLRATLYAIAKTYDDHELRQKAMEAYEESSPQPSAQQAEPICAECNGSGEGVADTKCMRCDGQGGFPQAEQPAEEARGVDDHALASRWNRIANSDDQRAAFIAEVRALLAAPAAGKSDSCYVCGQPAVYCASKHHTAPQAATGTQGLREALEKAYMALIGYLPAHRNAVTDEAINVASAALAGSKEA